MAKEKNEFSDYKQDALTKPRDKAWTNWMAFEKVGDKCQGFIRDVFFRPADSQFKKQRGLTLEQLDGTFINIGIKRLPFILNKTDDLRLGDPLTVELDELKKSDTKGFSPTKIFAFYGKNLPENAKNKTVFELEQEDMKKGGTLPPEDEADKEFKKLDDEEEKAPFA